MSEASHFWGRSAKVWAAPYALRRTRRMNWTDRTIRRIQGWAAAALAARRLSHRQRIARVIARSEQMDTSPDGVAKTLEELRPRLLRHGLKGRQLEEALAISRAVFREEMGFAHRAEQILGALRLLDGKLLEMATGEGKSATACLAACVAALAGLPVHVITVNDYLAGRDAETFAPVFARLGLSTGLITSDMDPLARKSAYLSAVVYVDNKELVFDFLKDRLALGRRRNRAQYLVSQGLAASGAPLVLRGLAFAIVDEADSILIDEAGTPLIISAASDQPEDPTLYTAALDAARTLRHPAHFNLTERGRRAELTPQGKRTLNQMHTAAGGIWRVPQAREELVEQALTALHIMERDTHYILDQEDGVVIVDEFTGRAMPDRSWRAGLHQLVELKEGHPLSPRKETAASITYQRFFRHYLRVSGMTGTGMEVSGEMRSVYDLLTAPVPTHRPSRRRHLGTHMVATQAEKTTQIIARTAALHSAGRAVLIGVRSVGGGDAVSKALTAAGLSHELLSARNDTDEAERVARAGEQGAIMVATNMAGRGTDIPLGPGVAEAGGLHVILTEFHESRRIDRQLYGRAGRQGDPGSTEDIVAFDDDLFGRHAAPLLRILAAIPGAKQMPLSATLLRRVAQARAEAKSATSRRAQLRAETDRLKSLAIAGEDPV